MRNKEKICKGYRGSSCSKPVHADDLCKSHYTSRFQQRKKYRLSDESEAYLVERAAGCCELCGATTSDLKTDHCHRSKVVRGLLCHHCNIGIGMLKDDPELMRKAIDWVTNNGPEGALPLETRIRKASGGTKASTRLLAVLGIKPNTTEALAITLFGSSSHANRQTVRRYGADLVRQGLVVRQRGIGSQPDLWALA